MESEKKLQSKTAVVTPTERRQKQPEIAWEYTARIQPGEYSGYCRAANVYWDRQFKRWVFAAQFDVFGTSLVEPLACLTWFLNLGSRAKPKAGRRTRYWAAWVNANGGPPKRDDKIAPRVFKGRYALVKVGDTAKNHLQKSISADQCYSVIRDVIEWQTGRPAR
jgi:hypothetical protein